MSGAASKTSASSHSDDRSAFFCNLGGQDTSRDQAVLSEVIDDAIERAFQENVALVHEDPLNCPCRAGGQEGQRLAWYHRHHAVRRRDSSAQPGSVSER